MSDAHDLAGRVVVVTGGAGLLGREYARALAEAGACVVAADLDGDRAEALAGRLRGRGGRALGVAVDVSSEESVARLVRATLETFGTIDGLVNNAALDPKVDADRSSRLAADFEHYPLAAWNASLATNLTGMFLCARAVLPVMRERGRGAIVNVSSTYGMVGPDQRLYEPVREDAPRAFKPVDYAVTKSGVFGLTRYLAAYLAGTRIRVNTLTPGGVRTDQPEEFVRRYSARTPLGRMAERHEYSAALLFLLSDASSYMTGSNMVVDGGWTAW